MLYSRTECIISITSRKPYLFPCTVPLKVKLLHCYIFPELLYGMEPWTIETLLKNIEAFVM